MSARQRFLNEVFDLNNKWAPTTTNSNDPELDENDESAYPETIASWSSTEEDYKRYAEQYAVIKQRYQDALSNDSNTSEEIVDDETVDEDNVDEEIAKVSAVEIDQDKRLVFGWAYVVHDTTGQVILDKSGKTIHDIEELEKAAYDFVLKSRQGDAHHDLVASSQMVESVVFTPEKIEKMGIPTGVVPYGWWVGFKVLNNDIWQQVKNGYLTSFSIHGTAIEQPIE